MNLYPKVKGNYSDKEHCDSGEFKPGKVPKGGFQSVWNFSDKKNNFVTKRDSPTSKPEND